RRVITARVRQHPLLSPRRDDAPKVFELFVEEVARARNDLNRHLRFRGEARGESAQVFDRAELVALALYEQERLAALLDEGEVVVALLDADGRADAYEVADARVLRPDFEADARAEGEAREEEVRRRIVLGQIVERHARVFLLAAARARVLPRGES